MRHLALVLIALVAFSYCSEGGSPNGADKAGQGDGRVAAESSQDSINTAAPKGSGAQKAYLDPETGDLVPPPKHEAPDRSESKSAAAKDGSDEKMAEKESPVPGGGVMVDLKGRFRKPSSASVEGTGETASESPTSKTSE